MRTPTRTSRIVIGRGGRLTRPLLVAALAAGLVVAGSSAAQAQSITDADAAGDMARYGYENGETRPAPNQVRNDVLRTRLTHGATRISIRVKYAELRRLGEGHSQYLQMVTNEGFRRGLDVSASRATGLAAQSYGERGAKAPTCGARFGTRSTTRAT